jgi:DNA-binding response OmpR family regulator
MTQSRNRRLYLTSGNIVGANASWPRTHILALTGEVQLHRLLRSLLAGELLALAPFELGVLTLLARDAGSVVPFGRILAEFGRADSAAARQALSSCVFRLRKRIERDPRRPDLLLTEARIGYRLAAESGDPLCPS